jgi:hypothetical protein
MNVVIQNLDTLIQLDNVHQWDALPSVYKWIKPQCIEKEINHPTTKDFYTSFCIGRNEYYILSHRTFMVYPTNKEIYNKLKIIP